MVNIRCRNGSGQEVSFGSESPAMNQDTVFSSLIKGIHAKLWGEYKKNTDVIQTLKEGRAAASRHEGHQFVGTVLYVDGILTRGVTFTEEGEVRMQKGAGTGGALTPLSSLPPIFLYSILTEPNWKQGVR